MQRLAALHRHLRLASDDDDDNDGAVHHHIEVNPTAAGTRTIRISDVTLTVAPAASPFKVPVNYLVNRGRGEMQETIRVLRFLAQKDTLGQDVYLIGPPGSIRRRLVKKYCELTQRAVEYVALSNDTTEADLKQRREISAGTALYVDCPATRAAIEGSVLILDGIEKAERNVLVVLNNLLENREMALEDGRFLCSPARYDALLKSSTREELEAWRLVRTSEKFRVVALGLPVPRYQGSTLDPPFRSRFQARDVQSPVAEHILSALAAQTKATPASVQKSFVQCALVLREMREADGATASVVSGLPEFPQNFEETAAALWRVVPLLSARDVSDFVFPFPSLLSGTASDDRLHVVRKVFRRFGLEAADAVKGFDDGLGAADQAPVDKPAVAVAVKLAGVRFDDDAAAAAANTATVTFHADVETFVSTGVAQLEEKTYQSRAMRGRLPGRALSSHASTPTLDQAMTRMFLAHCSGGDFCVVGEKGGGKSHLVYVFAALLGYDVELIPLYKDVSARALLQRRSTLSNGDTVWEDSPLVTAALTGRLAVLDGAEQMVPGTLATLQELVLDREVRLPDGRHLLAQARIDDMVKRDGISQADLAKRGVCAIHPAFRVVAVARPSFQGQSGTALSARGAWLSPELQGMFRFVYLPPISAHEQAVLLRQMFPSVRVEEMDRLGRFCTALRQAVAKDDMLSALESTVSLRQMIRVCRRLAHAPEGERVAVLHQSLLAASLDRFLPPMAHDALLKVLGDCDIVAAPPSAAPVASAEARIETTADDVLHVGPVSVQLQPARDALLVPQILFYDNPRQTQMMADMLRDWISGQHLLLIGNQGVGKNKLADRMLQLMRLPREYIQLHRDTTVANLTSNPTIVDGRLLYEDSPLVRAAREGRVLVVDEADKAPTYVTAVLKALVEDRSMLLADGRRIIDADAPAPPDGQCIRLHKEFRVIALANRPGFPFLGNDFFREVGDVFACHAIDNPDAESELHLMRQYGPGVAEDTLRRLIACFDELRALSDSGKLAYPYSTRELAAVVRHMERFPADGIDRILRNVFDFDAYHDDERQIIAEVFAKHGIAFSRSDASFTVSTGVTRALGPPRLFETWSVAQGELALPASFFALDKVARINHGNGTLFWHLRQPEVMSNLQRVDRSGAVFTEEQYSFKLPRCSVLGCTALADGRLLVAARASSFMAYVVSADHAKCLGYDLFVALPADGVFRSAPKLASVVAGPGKGQAYVSHQDGGYVYKLDVDRGHIVYFEKLPGLVKGSRVLLAGGGAGVKTCAVFQRGERVVACLNPCAADDAVAYAFCELATPVRDVQVVTEGVLLVLGDNGYTALVRFDKAAGSAVISVLRRASVAATVPEAVQVSQTPSRAVVGALPPGAARFVSGGGHVGFAVGLPNALLAGANASLYSVGAGVEGTARVQLRDADVWAVSREDKGLVEVDVVDLASMRARTLKVTVEEDALSASMGMPASGLIGHRPLTALTPTDLTAFAMRRRLVNEAAQLVFLAEAGQDAMVTVDFLGTVRVWLVTELAVRRAFAEWRQRVGFADDAPLQVQYVVGSAL